MNFQHILDFKVRKKFILQDCHYAPFVKCGDQIPNFPFNGIVTNINNLARCHSTIGVSKLSIFSLSKKFKFIFNPPIKQLFKRQEKYYTA